MLRLLALAVASTVVLLPATADAHSGVRLRGVVTAEDAAASLVTVSSTRLDHVLRVTPGSLARIRVGMRVELRGSTLRRHGNGSRVLSRGVLLVRSEARDLDEPGDDEIEIDDDELEVKGTLTSLAPLTVVAAGHSFVCSVLAGMSLAGFRVGDFVEMTCDLVGSTFVLRELELEDREDEDDDEDGDHSGPGRGGDDDHDDDSSGPGGGGH